MTLRASVELRVATEIGGDHGKPLLSGLGRCSLSLQSVSRI
jgi:hypothetical protein